MQVQRNHKKKKKKNIGAEQNLLTNFYCYFSDLYAHCLNQEECALNLTQISKANFIRLVGWSWLLQTNL